MTCNKIQYACRKTLADSRPRVRGRFAKNEELCEATRSGYQNHEQYEQTVSFQCITLSYKKHPNLGENSDSQKMSREMILDDP